MENKVMQEIVDFAINKLGIAYGFCGVMSGKDMASITGNDRNENDIKISFDVVPEQVSDRVRRGSAARCRSMLARVEERD